MGTACTSPLIGGGQLVENLCWVNIVPTLEYKIQQYLLHVVKTGTPVIMQKHVSNVIDFVARSICFFHIADMQLFRDISGEIVTGTHSPNWLWYMVYKMQLWISEMNYALFNGFPERLNADCLPPSFKLDQAEGEFLLEPHLLIQGDAINLSLKLVSHALQITQAPGCGICPSIG